MRRIICYGDSNTQGYDPRSPYGDDYPHEIIWATRLGPLLGSGNDVIMIHPHSGWFFRFGHSPNTTSCAQVRSKWPASRACLLLATRKRVSRVKQTQLVTFLILF